MDARRESEATPMKKHTTAVRKTEREIILTRTFNGPARIVFKAWTTPELLQRWWVPKSVPVSMIACEVDARTGGGYRFEFGSEGGESMAFFGKYLEVIPNARLVWTNEESPNGAVTTVTFEEKDGRTLLVMTESYSSKEALIAGAGMEDGMPDSFDQLDELLVTLGEGKN
jgi:uncharacterized protein YndB with AHSA1/START domain